MPEHEHLAVLCGEDAAGEDDLGVVDDGGAVNFERCVCSWKIFSSSLATLLSQQKRDHCPVLALSHLPYTALYLVSATLTHLGRW